MDTRIVSRLRTGIFTVLVMSILESSNQDAELKFNM